MPKTPKHSEQEHPAQSPRDVALGITSRKVTAKYNARVDVKKRAVELLQVLAKGQFNSSSDWNQRAAAYLFHLIDGQPPGMRIPNEIRRVVQRAFDQACKELGYTPPPKKKPKKRKR